MRNAFRWLEVEDNIQSTTMEEFLKKDVSRFGNHQILSWLEKMDTKRFVQNWAYPNYVYLKSLKRYAMNIPNAIRAQYDDIIAGRKGFDGQVRDLGDGTYIVTRLVWEARVKTIGVNNSTADEVHIMHRNGFFDGTSERVGESTLWIFDCRNCGYGMDGIWEEADYKKAMDRVEEWMQGGPR